MWKDTSSSSLRSRVRAHRTRTISIALVRLLWAALLAGAATGINAQPGTAANGAQLLEALRNAPREKNAKEARKQVERARALVEQGADVNTKGEFGRTPLHWIAIGTSQFPDRNTQRAYRELAEIAIDKGADVNAEDDFGSTPLDWEEANPEDSLRYIFAQAGAQYGSSHSEVLRMANYINALRGLAARKDYPGLIGALDADVLAGSEIRIRLTEPLHSKQSRCGDKLSAVVIAPARDNGKIVLSPSTKVEGTLLAVRPARNRFTRAEVYPDFTNFIHADGKITRIPTKVRDVLNSRETSNYGRVLGVPFPNEVVSRWTLGLRGLGFVLPGVSEGLQWATHAYSMTLGRDIDYPAGTELILRVSVPVRLETAAPQKGWREVPPSPELVRLVRSQPMRVKTTAGEDSDVTNLLFVGSAEDLETGFRLAGWLEAKSLSIKSGFRTALAAMRLRGYEEAPFSRLLLEEKDPDYEYQKDLNTVAKRHHLRVYRRPETYQGNPVWLASATHDIGIGAGRYGTKWYHLIDPEIDIERQKIADDMLFSGTATAYSLVERPDAPRQTQNGSGDEIRTDGRVMVLYLTSGEKQTARRGNSLSRTAAP